VICTQLRNAISFRAVRFVTFQAGQRPSLGVVGDRGIVDLAELLPADRPQAMLETLIDGFDALRGKVERLARTGAAVPADSVVLGASVPAPGKFLCVMRNRPALERASHPFAYLKSSAAAVGSGQVLRLPPGETELWHEAELAVVVRGPVHNLASSAWRSAVFGYTAVLDVVRPSSIFTAGSDGEDWWKSWDTPWAVGPTIVTADELAAPGRGLSLRITATAHRVEVADPGGPPLPEIITFLASVMTLRTGDLIACGAHEAATAAAMAGSAVEVKLPAIGSLAVRVAA
jgi:2-keto-4-pentenoate hydratase/2-oxohepta-3-ene-1,7-dioic acid hydratase in catechol pathway